jgi:hypothetical protein
MDEKKRGNVIISSASTRSAKDQSQPTGTKGEELSSQGQLDEGSRKRTAKK